MFGITGIFPLGETAEMASRVVSSAGGFSPVHGFRSFVIKASTKANNQKMSNFNKKTIKNVKKSLYAKKKSKKTNHEPEGRTPPFRRLTSRF